MLQKVAEIVYKKRESSSISSKDLTIEIIDLFPGNAFSTDIVTEIIAEYGKKGTGLEEAATRIIMLINPSLVDVVLVKETTNEEDSNKPVLVPRSEDEKKYIESNFDNPEYITKLVNYLRDSKNETVNVIDVQDNCDGEYVVNGVNYCVRDKEKAYEEAIQNRIENICDNAYEQAYDEIHNYTEELCWDVGYSCDEHEDDDVIIFSS